MVVKFTQAYMTTDYPDENGNYYYPVFVPENAHVQLPIVTSMPDASLGNRGIRYDWNTNSWTVSSDDPLIKKINTLEAQLNGLVSASKGDNSTSGDSSSVQPTAPASSASGTLSNMMNMFNVTNSGSSDTTSQAQPASSASSTGSSSTAPASSASSADVNSVNLDTPDPTKDSDK